MGINLNFNFKKLQSNWSLPNQLQERVDQTLNRNLLTFSMFFDQFGSTLDCRSIIIHQFNKMYERKNWTEEEDETLIKLIEQFEGKEWSKIAKTMEINYGITGRTGKQCRQRWHNSLNPALKGENWSLQNSMKLFEYHSIHGNRWAKIASIFGNRSDNSVKNHFYSTLRKAHRIINKYIKQHKKKLVQRPLKDSILSKVISLSEETDSSEQPPQLILKSKDLIGRLVDIAQQSSEHYFTQNMESVIFDLLEINKAYKLKKINKRKRKPITNQPGSEINFDSVHSQEQPKSLSEVSNPSLASPNIKKGFRLYDPKSCSVGSVSQMGSMFTPCTLTNSLNAPFPTSSNQCRMIFYTTMGYSGQDATNPVMYVPLWLPIQ